MDNVSERASFFHGEEMGSAFDTIDFLNVLNTEEYLWYA
jgi:hypothetical protein